MKLRRSDALLAADRLAWDLWTTSGYRVLGKAHEPSRSRPEAVGLAAPGFAWDRLCGAAFAGLSKLPHADAWGTAACANGNTDGVSAGPGDARLRLGMGRCPKSTASAAERGDDGVAVGSLAQFGKKRRWACASRRLSAAEAAALCRKGGGHWPLCRWASALVGGFAD